MLGFPTFGCGKKHVHKEILSDTFVLEHSVGRPIFLRQHGILFSNAVLRCDIEHPFVIFIADVPNLGKMLSISASKVWMH